MRHRLRQRRNSWIALIAVTGLLVSYPLWKPLAKRNRDFVIATNIGLDLFRLWGLKSEQIGQNQIISPLESELANEQKYVHEIYQRYLRYAGLRSEDVGRKRVIEL